MLSLIVVRQDDGSYAAYDDNRYDGDVNSLSIGRGDTEAEALEDFAEALENSEEGGEIIREVLAAQHRSGNGAPSAEIIAIFELADQAFAQLWRRMDRARPEPADQWIEETTTKVRNEMARLIAVYNQSIASDPSTPTGAQDD